MGWAGGLAGKSFTMATKNSQACLPSLSRNTAQEGHCIAHKLSPHSAFSPQLL